MATTFSVGISRDLRNGRGEATFGPGPLTILQGLPGLTWDYLPETVDELTPEYARLHDAIYLNTPRVTARTVSGPDLRLRIVGRHGAGYDSVDLDAMSRAGVIVTNTPEAVRRPVALMVMTFILALAHKLLAKDRITRQGRWNDRAEYMGSGITGKVVGIIGAGGIGRETMKLTRAFDMRVIAAKSKRNANLISPDEAELVPLDTLLAEADFVVLTCLLNHETHHLMNEERLRRMKPSAFLINVARGGVVDEPALIAALREGVIAGAGLDVFEREPVGPDNPLLSMDNVVLAPHALGWTEETFASIAQAGLQSIVDLLERRPPKHIVNREVLDHPRVKTWFSTNQHLQSAAN